MPFLVVFLLITIACLIPFGIALFYFILGAKTLLSGKREKSRTKTISGYNTIFISGISMIALYAGWYWLCRAVLSSPGNYRYYRWRPVCDGQ